MQSPSAFTQVFLRWRSLPQPEDEGQQPYNRNMEEAIDLSMKSDTSVEEEELSNSSSDNSSPRPEYAYNITTPKLKFARPFKAYKKDFRAVAQVPAITMGFPSFDEFRRKMSINGQETHTNKNMRRQTQRTSTQSTDPSYLEKRRKNNEAAKRSRDARRQKEDDLALMCAFLEGENTKLKLELHVMQKELNLLRSRCSN